MNSVVRVEVAAAASQDLVYSTFSLKSDETVSLRERYSQPAATATPPGPQVHPHSHLTANSNSTHALPHLGIPVLPLPSTAGDAAPIPPLDPRLAIALWRLLRVCVFNTLIAGWVCYAVGLHDLAGCNTPVSALVTGTYPSHASFHNWTPACASNISYVSRDGATRDATVLLDVAAATASGGGGCPSAGAAVPMCYNWEYPGRVCAGGCGRALSHASALALLTAGLVITSLAAAAVAALVVRRVRSGTFDFVLLRWL